MNISIMFHITLIRAFNHISDYLDWIVETIASHENNPAITLENLRCF